jgi:predicted Zn-dependent protease
MRLAPGDFTAYHLRAVIRLDAERFADAAEAFREALARDPPAKIRPALVRGLVQSLTGQHEYEAALAAAAEASLHPLPPDAARLALEAECRWSLGQVEQARELLDQAAQIDPAEPRVPQLRARLLVEAGRAADAVPLLEDVLARDPHDFESRYRLSLAFRRLGQTDRADEEMHRMQESRALRRRLTDLSDLAVAEPRNAQVRDELAGICEELGKPDLARLYRQAAEACRGAAPTKNRGGN